jgi:hypothetical protein
LAGEIDWVRQIFEDYRNGGVNMPPQQACGNICKWLRDGAVKGREAEAAALAIEIESERRMGG